MTRSSFLVDRLRKLRKGEVSHSAGPLRIHRRQLLQGVGVAGVAAAGWLAADVLDIRRVGRKLLVSMGAGEWTIDPAVFGHGAAVAHRATQGRHWLRLSRAALPGTDLPMDFVAAITRMGMDWLINIHLPALNFRAKLPLSRWLNQSQAFGAAIPKRKICFGGQTVTIADGARLAMGHGFQLDFSGADFSLNGTIAASGRQLRIAPGGELALLDRMGTPAGKLASLAMRDIRLREDRLGLGSLEPEVGVSFVSDRVESLSVEAGMRSGVPVSALLLEGVGAIQFTGVDGKAPRNHQLHLDRAAIMTSGGIDNRLCSVAGHVRAKPFPIALSMAQAQVSGHRGHPLALEFQHGKASAIFARVKLHDLWMSVPDGDSAVGKFQGRLVRLDIPGTCDEGCLPLRDYPEATGTDFDVIRWGTVGQSSNHSDRPNFVLEYQAKAQDNIVLNADKAPFFLSRGYDLFYLGFLFDETVALKTVRLDKGQNTPVLLRTRPGHTTMTVMFEPQFLAESWYDPNPANSSDPALILGTDPSTDAAHVHISARSRLVFDMGADWQSPLLLSIEALTKWDTYKLRTSCRAKRADIAPVEEMGKGLYTSDLATYMQEIAATIVPPAEDQTMLELAGQLQFSPAADAGGWLLSDPNPKRDNAELWHARLDEAARKHVRALWAGNMRPHMFNYEGYDPDAAANGGNDNATCAAPGGGDIHDWAVRRDLQWEIVAQTSIYGLPALRARRLQEDALDKDVHNVLQNLPRSRVVRLENNTKVLNELDVLFANDAKLSGPAPREAGIALTKAFDEADIILTSLGGALRADWQGEPPKLRSPGKGVEDKYVPPEMGRWPSGFNLEQFSYQTQFGRDIFVKTVEKGYLLPLGCRASYVSLTERRLAKSAAGGVVAVPIQRRFIVINMPNKVYPGLYQPYDGRDFPAGEITMVTRVTPDLKYVCDLTKPFWPQAAGTKDVDPMIDPEAFAKACVDFQWTTDNGAGPLTSKMLFVPNSALNNAEEGRVAADMYNNQLPVMRSAAGGGARCRYAPSLKDGDTSFTTHNWIMKVRGRQEAGNDTYVMDSFMEGASQPPFYPYLESAQLTVQSLDRLMGKNHGPVDVRFNRQYILNGFAENKEIYLDVVPPASGTGIEMNAVDNGATVGGVGKTRMYLAALSRSKGLVGAAKLSALPPAPPPAPAGGVVVAATSAPAPAEKLFPDPAYDIADALTGNFMPEKFFSGMKLLGFDLSPLLLQNLDMSHAPSVVETLVYGRPDAGLDGLGDAIKGEVGKLRKAFEDFAKGLNDLVLAKINYQLVRIYPRLAQRLTETGGALATLDDLLTGKMKPPVGTSNRDAVISNVMAVIACGKALSAEIDAIVQNPIPAIIPEEINVLTRKLAGIASELKNDREVARQGIADADQTLKGVVCNGLTGADPAAMKVLLMGDVDCDQLFSHPDTAAATARDALLEQFFYIPLQKSLLALQAIANEYKSEIDQAFLAQADAIVSAGVRAVANLGTLLSLTANLRAAGAVWCTSWREMDAFVISYTDTLLAGASDLAAMLADLQADILTLNLPDADYQALKAPLDALTVRVNALRSGLPEAWTACPTPAAIAADLDAIRKIMNVRRDIPGAFTDFLTAVTPYETKASFVAKTRRVMDGVTVVGQLQEAGLREQLAVLIAVDANGYGNEVGEKITALARAASTLKARAVNTVAELQTYQLDVSTFLEREERDFIVTVLETALPVASGILNDLDTALRGFASPAIQALVLFHKGLVAVMDSLLNPSPGVDDALKLTLTLVGSPGSLDTLAGLRRDVNDAEVLLTPFEADPFQPKAVDTFRKWNGEISTMPAYRAVQFFITLLDTIAKGRLQDIFGDQKLREDLLKKYRGQMQEFIESLLPTHADIRYDWTATIKQDSDKIFLPGTLDVETPHNTLTISSHVLVDLIHGQREVTVQGKLEAFVVALTGGQDLIKLEFGDGVEFTSVNGSSPAFKAKVTNVRIGALLDFIQQLEAWLSPSSGSGFFLNLTESQVEAGYIFDAGIIDMGELQFINVALIVKAILPFHAAKPEDDRAIFWFGLGDEEHPFLIACPPYGGGGFVGIRSSGKEVVGLEAQFMFGGAAALHFGPLKAQGRLMAGLYMRQAATKENLISGFFEAVGEGSVACFSLCVFMRIAVFQQGSNIEGAATYGFEFRVGLAKITYRVTAHYTVQGKSSNANTPGGNSGKQNFLPPMDCAAVSAWTSAPLKHRQWKAYADSGMAMELLKG